MQQVVTPHRRFRDSQPWGVFVLGAAMNDDDNEIGQLSLFEVIGIVFLSVATTAIIVLGSVFLAGGHIGRL
jgi:hypothetical protein